jgi:hypothetical protein
MFAFVVIAALCLVGGVLLWNPLVMALGLLVLMAGMYEQNERWGGRR